jgi:hypothetical protein
MPSSASVGAADGGETEWQLDLATYAAPDLPMRVVDGSPI